MISSDKAKNPEFSDWNKIVMRYCDGVGFIGNTELPFNLTNYEGKGINKVLYFRGMQNVFETLDHLRKNEKLKTNLYSAKELVLAGSSAGGQAVLTYSNYFKKHFERLGNFNVKLYSIADSGVFLSRYNFEKKNFHQRIMWLELSKYIENKEVIKTYCDFTHSEKASNFTNCFFPDYFVHRLRIPVLVLQSLYDSWVIKQTIGFDCFISKAYSSYKLEGCPEDFISKIDDYKNILILKFSNINNNFFNLYMPDCLGHNYIAMSNAYDLDLIPQSDDNDKGFGLIKSPRDAVKNFIEYYRNEYYKINLNSNSAIDLADETALKPFRIISGNQAENKQLPVCSQVFDGYYYVASYGLEDFLMEGKWNA